MVTIMIFVGNVAFEWPLEYCEDYCEAYYE